jgi:hypothetical protein
VQAIGASFESVRVLDLADHRRSGFLGSGRTPRLS